MPNYKYRVIFEDGRVGRGKLIAANKTSAIEKLKMDNSQPIMLKRTSETKPKFKKIDYNKLKPPAPKHTPRNKKKLDITKVTLKELREMDLHPFSRVKTKDIVTFVNNLYILKKAKFNNVQALQSVYDSTENPAFKEVVEDIMIGVEAGERLYSVMEGYPKIFPPMFVNFVKVGEESGNLDTALLYARDYVESSAVLTKKIRGAIIPRVLQFVGIMGAMFAALLIGVPMLEDIYKMFDSKESIPAATLFAVKVAKWTLVNWYIVLRSYWCYNSSCICICTYT